MKGPLQPIAAQEQQLEPQERSLAAGAKGNASLLATTTKMSVTTTTHSPSPPPPVFEPVDDAPVAFAKSLALAKKVAETGDASVDLGGEDENGKREKSGGTINVDAPGGVAAHGQQPHEARGTTRYIGGHARTTVYELEVTSSPEGRRRVPAQIHVHVELCPRPGRATTGKASVGWRRNR